MRARWAGGLLLACMFVGQACAEPTARERALYGVATGHYVAQQWAEAAGNFAAYLDAFPTGELAPRARFYLAEALLQAGRLPDAQAAYAEFLTRHSDLPEAVQARCRQAEALFFQGEGKQAQKILEDFLRVQPPGPQAGHALFYLGQIALRDSRWTDAEKLLNSASEQLGPGLMTERSRLGWAQARLAQGRTEDVEPILLAAARQGHPCASEARFRLGEWYQLRHDLPAAEQSFARAAEIFNPYRERALLRQALCLHELRHPEKAQKILRSLTSHPQFGSDAHAALGRLAHDANRPGDAAAHLVQSAEASRDPARVPALLYQAGLWFALADRVDESLQCLARVRTEYPQSEWVTAARQAELQARLAEKDWDAAAELVKESLTQESNPKNREQIQRTWGRALLQAGKTQEALEALEPILKGEPTAEDKYVFAWAAFDDGHRDIALELFTEVVEDRQAAADLRADARLGQGAARLAQGDYAEAAETLRTALGEQRNSRGRAACLARLALAEARIGRWAESKFAYDRIAKETTTGAALAILTQELAEVALAGGQRAFAAQLFARLQNAELPPARRAQALSGLGWSQFEQGDFVGAAATLEAFLKAYPEDSGAPESARLRAQALFQAKQPAAAAAAFEDLIAKYPQSKFYPMALVHAAKLRDELKQDAEAAAHYEQLIGDLERLMQVDPTLPSADRLVFDYAGVLIDLGRTTEAGEVYEELRKSFPESPHWSLAVHWLAEQAWQSEDYVRAEQLLAELLSRPLASSLRERATFLLGMIAARTQRWADAQTRLSKFLESFPDSRERGTVRYWLAEALAQQGQIVEASDEFTQLQVLCAGEDPTLAARSGLRHAQLLFQRKQFESAQRVLMDILKQFPTFSEVHELYYLLGRCLASQGQFPEARAAYHRALDMPVTRQSAIGPQAQWMLGETYFHQRDYPRALRAYLQVEVDYSASVWRAAALLQAGKCYQRQQQPAEARVVWERLLRECPEAPFAAQAEELLRTLPKS